MYSEKNYIKCMKCETPIPCDSEICPNCGNVLKVKKRSKTKIFIASICSFLLAFVIVSGILKVIGRSNISLREFESITAGMTYSEVVRIIGSEGTLFAESSIEFPGYSQYDMCTYSWEGNGGRGSNAAIVFQGGKVVSKAQVGLK